MWRRLVESFRRPPASEQVEIQKVLKEESNRQARMSLEIKDILNTFDMESTFLEHGPSE